MRKSAIFLILCPSLAFSQKIFENKYTTLALPSRIFNLEADTSKNRKQLPFKQITIIDARLDTSKIGFAFKQKVVDFSFDDFYKVELNGGVKNALENFCKSSFQFSDTGTTKLFIVLKKLWIDFMPGYFSTYSEKRYAKNTRQNIHIKLETYLQKNEEYKAFKRIDTIYQLTSVNESKDFNIRHSTDMSFFKTSFSEIIQQLSFAPSFYDFSSRILTYTQIEDYSLKRLKIPVLNANSINPGVYMSTLEFINNKPSVSDYNITGRDLPPARLERLHKTYFAYCDAEGIHFMPENSKALNINALKKMDLWKCGNTYEFFEYTVVALPKTLGGKLLNLMGSPTGPTNNNVEVYGSDYKLRRILFPRQLDMETGIIY